MKKNILIIGNSVKELALARKMSEQHDVFVAPGNDNFKEFATCLDIREDAVGELLEFVMENDINLTIPISEKSLKTNIVEVFTNNNQQIFAPNKDVSKYIFDKALTKKILYKLRIPTPKFGIFEKQNMAFDYLKNKEFPYIIKTNDNASAVIINSQKTAKIIIESLFTTDVSRVIIEDYVWGTPFSFYVVTDGYKALPIGASKVYRYSLDGDGGQLTSGLGAIFPNYKLSFEAEDYILQNIVYPLLDFFECEGASYLGILGINGILTETGEVYVLGLQNFMQDVDASAVLEVLDEDLYSLFESCIIGSFSDEKDFIVTKDVYSASIVLACKNKKSENNVIYGLENIDENIIVSFYPNVLKNKYLEYEALNGLNLSLTATGRTLSSAVNKIYEELKDINYNGMFYRKDICKRDV